MSNEFWIDVLLLTVHHPPLSQSPGDEKGNLIIIK